MSEHSHIIGIDLGTTNSVVAVIEGGEPKVIYNLEGQPKTPSVIAFMDDGQAVVGEIARRQAATQPQRTISSVKRLMGRMFSDIHSDVEQYPFDLAENEDGKVAIRIGEKLLLPQEISSLVLAKLKEAAEVYLDEPVTRAIVTVPAYFDDLQRQATMQAARQAGLEVLRLLNEPTAAAMAYGLGREGQHIVAVYDFGGGTFDFSILEVDTKTFEVLVSTGDSHLGGDDLDTAIVDFVATRFQEQNGIDLRQDMLTLRRLKDAAEAAKCELSSAYETLISLPFITYRNGEPLHLEMALQREVLEELIEPMVKETLDCCMRGLRDSKLRKNQINKVILVGGSTRIPLVQDLVEDFFGLPPFKGLNPDEIVALGAATQGGVMNGELEEVVLLDITPHCLGIEIKGNRKSAIIEKNSTIPIKVSKLFTTTEDNQSFVNIHVLQGDGEKATECRSLGKFTLSDINSQPAGVPRIKVTFFINADGIVEIGAADLASGAEKKLAINHSHLDVKERRAQNDQDAVRRRRRRRTASIVGGRMGDRKSGTATQYDATPLPRAGTSPSDTMIRERQALAATFEELVEVKANERLAAHVAMQASEKAQATNLKPDETQTQIRRADASSSDANAKPAAAHSPAPVPMATPPPARTPAPPPAQTGPQMIPLNVPDDTGSVEQAQNPLGSSPSAQRFSSRLMSEIPLAPTAATEAPAAQHLDYQPGVTLPENLKNAAELLIANHIEPMHEQLLRDVQHEFTGFCRINKHDVNLCFLLARLFIYLKQPEDSRNVLEETFRTAPGEVVKLMDVYRQLCQAFPNYYAARKGRTDVAMAMGDFKTAITDIEFVVNRDEKDQEAQERQMMIYQAVLEQQQDPTIQFKLVKIFLRRQQLDQAIGLLQQLVAFPEYRDRANKVLGLCFWQKGMLYLSWQKFRNLPVDNEMKDILYRLAADMEHHDELLHARYALERILEADYAYRDVNENLKKIIYRLELQKDQRYGAGVQPNTAQADSMFDFGGRFEVLNEINRGSMGIVYRARDLILDEIVAIKVLNDFLCSDPLAVERFKLEARSARKLSHPNIVRIHDMFDLNNKKIISMEFIEGKDLKSVISEEGCLAVEKALNYLVQICEGLAFAHRRHVVHRDIKPANIMIATQTNQIKITDFGIAKLVTDTQTKSGTIVMGTPLYMAPEQIEGGKIDNRCDIYSLGIMLYELVTGRPPFFEGNIEYQHINLPAPEIKQEIGENLRLIINKCIEKDPDKRFQSIDEILSHIF